MQLKIDSIGKDQLVPQVIGEHRVLDVFKTDSLMKVNQELYMQENEIRSGYGLFKTRPVKGTGIFISAFFNNVELGEGFPAVAVRNRENIPTPYRALSYIAYLNDLQERNIELSFPALLKFKPNSRDGQLDLYMAMPDLTDLQIYLKENYQI